MSTCTGQAGVEKSAPVDHTRGGIGCSEFDLVSLVAPVVRSDAVTAPPVGAAQYVGTLDSVPHRVARGRALLEAAAAAIAALVLHRSRVRDLFASGRALCLCGYNVSRGIAEPGGGGGLE